MELSSLLDLIAQKTGKQPKKRGKNYSCLCPSHDDKNPSLSISQSHDGKLLLKCHTGCGLENICESLNIKVSELFPEKPNTLRDGLIAPTYYEYCDEKGIPLFRKVRYNNQPKSFKIERWQNDIWSSGLRDCRRVLYHLPEVLEALREDPTICICEGEKDVETLRCLGFVATTNFDGAGKWLESYSELLKEANIILFYDYDTAGLKHRDLVTEALKPVVKSLKVVNLGFDVVDKHGKDVSDWIKDGHTLEDLMHLIRTAKNLCEDPLFKVKVLNFDDLMEMQIPDPVFFLTPFICQSSTGMIYAKRGVGKTMFGLELAYAMATGGQFLSFKGLKPCKVLYIDGEMPPKKIQNRLRVILGSEKLQPLGDNLILLSQILQDTPLPSLGTKEFNTLIDPIIQSVNVVIVDNLATLVTRGNENEGKDWSPVQNWLLNIRRAEKAVILVHHAGKSGQQRGTSQREDTLDYVIKLSRHLGYQPTEGARFIIEFEKGRDLYGEDVKIIEATMKTSPDKKTREWSFCDYLGLTENTLKEAKILRDAGQSIRQIAEITGVSKSKLQRDLKTIEDVSLPEIDIEEDTEHEKNYANSFTSCID